MKFQLAFHLLIVDDSSVLPSPTSSLSSSEYLFLSVHSVPAPVCHVLCTTLLSKILYCKISNVYFFVFYVLFIEKYDKIIIVQYHIAD